jgi:hypothetical protein
MKSLALDLMFRGNCTQAYPEYLVRIERGKPNVFGLNSDTEAAIECPLISALVFGKTDLKFPLDVGLSRSDDRSRQVPGLRPKSVHLPV